MSFKGLEILPIIEALGYLFIGDAIEVEECEFMVRTSRKKRVIGSIRTSPDFFDHIVCKLAL